MQEERSLGGARLIAPEMERLESALLAAVARCGGAAAASRAMPLAVSVELLHMASLVHDDVIDQAATRRGIATANAERGNRMAVLAGDYLFAKAFLVTVGRGYGEDIAGHVAGIVRDLMAGEMRQDAHLHQPPTMDEYLGRIRLKTASFFATCCRLGALVAKADRAAVSALGDFGLRLGMAFQLTDDLLDITGDGERLGKPAAGSDLAQGVITMPVIRALETSADRDELRAIVTDAGAGPDCIARAVAIVRGSDGPEYTRRKANRYVGTAVASLPEKLPADIEETLVQLAGSAVNRDR